MIATEPNGKYSAIDLFCGAGGVTCGLEQVDDVKVITAINHSKEAIEAHKASNPDVLHLVEDIREHKKILPHLPKKINILWASAECTNHSNAKGGQSRDADSRSLPEYLDAYVEHCSPDVFFVENVKEFMDWGPLVHKRNKHGKLMYDKKKKPIYCTDKKRKGIYFKKWIKDIEALGYKYDYKYLNAADYGVHTSRVRFFASFVRVELIHFFPVPTHSKNPEGTGLLKWLACKEKINLTDEGKSIFGRSMDMSLRANLRKELSPKTHKRFAFGIRRFFLNDFIAKNFSSERNVSSLDVPLHNIDTRDRHFKVKLNFISNMQQSTGECCYCPESVVPPITTNCQFMAVVLDSKQFIADQQYNEKRVADINEPLKTIMPTGGKVITSLKFITQNIQCSTNASSINEPLNTILTKDEKVVVSVEQSKFIVKKHSAADQVGSVEVPFHSILTHPGEQVVTVCIEETELNKLKLKEKTKFFHTYFSPEEAEFLDCIITDIKARYLTSYELADISGFPKGVHLGKSETLRKKHIGNAVPPKLAKVLAEAFIEGNKGRMSLVVNK